MSPERIGGKMQKDIEFNKKSDIWSIGVFLYIFICGRPPFDA
jgi:serine/threonine protein kinase